jgi:hypothetical protein
MVITGQIQYFQQLHQQVEVAGGSDPTPGGSGWRRFRRRWWSIRNRRNRKYTTSKSATRKSWRKCFWGFLQNMEQEEVEELLQQV